MLKKIINFKLIISLIIIISYSNLYISKVSADAQCGTGSSCWSSNGGDGACFSSCYLSTSNTCTGSGSKAAYCSCPTSGGCGCTLANCTCRSNPNTSLNCYCSSTGALCSAGYPCGNYDPVYDTYDGTCGACTTIYDCSSSPTVGSNISCCFADSTPTATPAPTAGAGTPANTPIPTSPPPQNTPTPTPFPTGQPTPTPTPAPPNCSAISSSLGNQIVVGDTTTFTATTTNNSLISSVDFYYTNDTNPNYCMASFTSIGSDTTAAYTSSLDTTSMLGDYKIVANVDSTWSWRCTGNPGGTCGVADEQCGSVGSRCELDIAVVTPTPHIQGNFYQDDSSAVLSGNRCINGSTSLSLTGSSISSVEESTSNPGIGSIAGSTYTVEAIDDNETYEIRLDLTGQTDPANTWACSCPTPFGGNSLDCRYFSQDTPQNDLNFYLVNIDLSNEAWWQTVGGGAYAQNSISSNVPYTNCDAVTGCYAGMIAGFPFDNSLDITAGFPVVNTGSIDSHKDSGTQPGYIHVAGSRMLSGTANADLANTDGASIKKEDYSFFYSHFGSDAATLSNYQPTKPTANADGSTNIHMAIGDASGNVMINDSNTWDVAAGESYIVFVDGDLTIDDSTGNNQITTVAQGGFLAFIVSGDITITSDVGYSLPGSPGDELVMDPASTLPNIEGVFMANQQLTIESNADPNAQDRKFFAAGTFVGWNGVDLQRSFDDGVIGMADHNTNATETFIYRPDLIINMPIEMKISQFTWQEVAPGS